MKIINNEIRPVGYAEIEFNEAEIQTIICVMDELQMIKHRSQAEILGLRGHIYHELVKLLNVFK